MQLDAGKDMLLIKMENKGTLKEIHQPLTSKK